MAKEIFIPFKSVFREMILSGRKTTTIRYEKYGEIGDYFIINRKKFIIKDIKRMPCEEAIKKYYKTDGLDSERDLRIVWHFLHPRRRINGMVYVHFFQPENTP